MAQVQYWRPFPQNTDTTHNLHIRCILCCHFTGSVNIDTSTGLTNYLLIISMNRHVTIQQGYCQWQIWSIYSAEHKPTGTSPCQCFVIYTFVLWPILVPTFRAPDIPTCRNTLMPILLINI